MSTDHKKNIHKSTISIMLTTFCTLRCKHCQIKIPYMTPEHIDKEIILSSVERLFEVVDFVDDLAVMGGEFMLHPDIVEIISELAQYHNQYNRIVLVTNGTLLPSKELIQCLQEFRGSYVIRIDDYGKLSTKVSELSELATTEKLNFEIRPYNVDNSYGENGGGWVDVVGDFEYKNYSDEELQNVYQHCHNAKTCVFLWGNKLFNCGMHAAGVILGKFDDRNGIDSVNLLSNEDLEKKRKVVSEFGTFAPNGCRYCNGFDVYNSQRILPAQQIEVRT